MKYLDETDWVGRKKVHCGWYRQKTGAKIIIRLKAVYVKLKKKRENERGREREREKVLLFSLEGKKNEFFKKRGTNFEFFNTNFKLFSSSIID